MAESVVVSGKVTHVAVNAGPATLRVRGEGDPVGAVLGNVTVNNADPAGVPVSGWTANDDRWNDDGNSDKLIGPLEPPNTQTSFWVLTQRGGSTAVVRRRQIGYGAYGTYRVNVAEDNAYDEQVDLRYDGDDAGVNPFFAVVPVAGKAVPDGTRVYIRQGNAAPDASITQAELNTLKADLGHLQSEIAAIAGRPAGQAVVTTQIDEFSVTGNTLRLQWTRNGEQHTDDVALPQHQVNFHDFAIVRTPADLAAAATTETLFVGRDFGAFATGDVLDYDQAASAWAVVLNLIPAIAAGAIGTAQLANGSVTRAKLSAALVTMLNGKLDAHSLKTTSTIVELLAFEAALKTEWPIGRATAEVHASNSAVYLGNLVWPAFKPDSDVTARIQRSGDAPVDVAQTFAASALDGKSLSPPSQGSSANSVRFSTGAEAYGLSKGPGNRIVFSADTDGDYTVTISVTEIDATRYVDDLPETALDDATQRKINDALAQTGHTDEEIRALADEEIHRLGDNVDVVASKTVVPAADGNGTRITLNLGFSIGSLAFAVVDIFRGANGDPDAHVSPATSRNDQDFLGYDIAYNVGTEHETVLQVVNARRTSDTSEHDEYRWQDEHGGRPAFENPCKVEVRKPPAKPNYVPGIGTGVFKRENAGDQAEFDALDSGDLADDIIEGRHIAPNAVAGPKIAANVRLPNATRLDDGQVALTQAGGWAPGHVAPQAQRVQTAPPHPRHGARILMLAAETLTGWGVLKAGQFSTGPVGYGSSALYTQPYGTLAKAADGQAFGTDVVQAVHSGATGGNTEIVTYLTTQTISKIQIASLDENGAPGAFVSHNVVQVAGSHRHVVSGNPVFEVGQTYLVRIEDGSGDELFPDIALEEAVEYDWGDGRWVRVTEEFRAWAVQGGPKPAAADIGIWQGSRAQYNALSADDRTGYILFLISG